MAGDAVLARVVRPASGPASKPGGRAKNLASGLSLVELMVSLVITSVLTLGLMEMFSAYQAANRQLQGQALVAGSGRVAMELISRSLRQAGYRGCNSKRPLTETVTNLPYRFDLQRGLAGYNATGSSWVSNNGRVLAATGGTSSPDAPPDLRSLTGVTASRLLPGADLVTVWFAASKAYPVDTATSPLTTGAEAVRLVAPIADIEQQFEDAPLALISDCNTENIFLITAINETSGQPELEHAAGVNVAAVPGARNATPVLGNGFGYRAGSLVSAVESHTYFVARSDNLNQQREAIYSLFRKEGIAGRRVELLEGVEELQFLYGVATTGDAPSTYVDASQVVDFRDVVSVRIQLTANSVDAAGSPEPDGRFRNTWTRTVRLPNQLGHR